MPLLCISLLALLLLPLSLSCDSKTPPREILNHYMAIVSVDLDNTDTSIEASLQNSTCPQLRHKARSCTPSDSSFVSTLHTLTCKMKTLQLSHTDRLVSSVIHSLNCPCQERPTKEPNVTLKKRRTVTRRRRNGERRIKTRTLCKAKAILSSMNECYQMLNSRYMDT